MTDLWRSCFLASLTGYIANPYTTEAEGIPCDDIAQWAANQADAAVELIAKRWPVKKARAARRSAVARPRRKKRATGRR